MWSIHGSIFVCAIVCFNECVFDVAVTNYLACKVKEIDELYKKINRFFLKKKKKKFATLF